MNRIAVDFDGTLCRSLEHRKVGTQSIFHKIVLAYVKRKQKQGVVVILNTARTNALMLKQAVDWLKEKGFVPDYVNENSLETLNQWGEDSRKIDADIFIDDRNVGLIGFLLRTF